MNRHNKRIFDCNNQSVDESQTSIVLSEVKVSNDIVVLNNVPEKVVRFVYAIPANKFYSPSFENAIITCGNTLQKWFFEQMGGKTFMKTSKNRFVEIVKLDQEADWYTKGGFGDSNTFFNVLQELSNKLGVRQFDPNNIWVIYADVPDNKGRGENSVCIMPGDDLLGLSGHHSTQINIDRWIMGSGHELGHALGLQHPPGCEINVDCKDPNAMMWTGFYTNNPLKESYLTEKDKDILSSSPFFSEQDERAIYNSY